jgi:hypothetical protein
MRVQIMTVTLTAHEGLVMATYASAQALLAG